MIWNILFVFLLLTTVIVVDESSMLFLLFVYLIGSAISFVWGGQDRKRVTKTFHSVFTIASAFMLMSFVFMTTNNYSFLLAFDTEYYFLPITMDYMLTGSYWGSLDEIWSNYDFFDRFQSGYFTYATLFGFLSEEFGANFYLGQQISVLLLYSFVGVVIYKLLKVNSFSENKSFNYTLIICIFSILFFYSSQILRDTHILLMYLLGIYFTFKKDFSLINLLKIVLVIFIVSTLRTETGLFMIVLIPVYLLLSLHRSKKKIIVLFVFGLISIGAIALSMVYFPEFSESNEYIAETYGGDKGMGVIGTLQKIPVAGNVVAIVYNAAQPIPFWSRLSTTSIAKDDLSVYNSMNFPRSFAAFFNWLVIVYIVFWLFNKSKNKFTKSFIPKPLLYQIWIGFIFLFLQSDVISQRRLLPYYVMFYILFFIIYNNLLLKKRKQINLIVVISFILIQVVGIVYLN